MTKLAANQERRVIQSILETQRMLDRANRYSPEFRDKELVAFCERHLAKLQSMLGNR